MEKAIVIYETTYGYTETMAKAIVAGLKEAGVEVEVNYPHQNHRFWKGLQKPWFTRLSASSTTLSMM